MRKAFILVAIALFAAVFMTGCHDNNTNENRESDLLTIPVIQNVIISAGHTNSMAL